MRYGTLVRLLLRYYSDSSNTLAYEVLVDVTGPPSLPPLVFLSLVRGFSATGLCSTLCVSRCHATNLCVFAAGYPRNIQTTLIQEVLKHLRPVRSSLGKALAEVPHRSNTTVASPRWSRIAYLEMLGQYSTYPSLPASPQRPSLLHGSRSANNASSNHS